MRRPRRRLGRRRWRRRCRGCRDRRRGGRCLRWRSRRYEHRYRGRLSAGGRHRRRHLRRSRGRHVLGRRRRRARRRCRRRRRGAARLRRRTRAERPRLCVLLAREPRARWTPRRGCDHGDAAGATAAVPSAGRESARAHASNARSSSRVIAPPRSPSARAASAIARFFSCSARMPSSTVSFATSR